MKVAFLFETSNILGGGCKKKKVIIKTNAFHTHFYECFIRLAGIMDANGKEQNGRRTAFGGNKNKN